MGKMKELYIQKQDAEKAAKFYEDAECYYSWLNSDDFIEWLNSELQLASQEDKEDKYE